MRIANTTSSTTNKQSLLNNNKNLQEQMISTQQRTSHCSFRRLIIYVFITMILLYLLYLNHMLTTTKTNTKPNRNLSTLNVHSSFLNHSTTTTTTTTNTTTKSSNITELPAKTRNSTSTSTSTTNNKTSNIIELPTKTRHPPKKVIQPTTPSYYKYDTEIKHIAFGIAASSTLWDSRKEYIKTWWRPKETRGVVWMDKQVKTYTNESLPDIMVSEDTSHFKYTNNQGSRSALRITRVVSETLRLGMKDIRWFVMGDDDTVFIVNNVVRVLSKYDHTQFYYIGTGSESHIQNIFFSYAMAYGGGGFAISYPLALELSKMQDKCIQRYPALYGSDDRIQACMAELGVPLTRELGFHQYDVYGDLVGLLGAHPVTPFVSLHHLDVVQPIFPRMKRSKAIEHLFEASKQDSASLMQQSICYDSTNYWSITVSWGYVVQILRGVMSPRELEMPTRTFLNWYKKADYTAYAFNTRPVERHPCQKPFLFYMRKVRYDSPRKQTISVYYRHKIKSRHCRWKTASPERIESIVVLKKKDDFRWRKSPRRDCCRVLPSYRNNTMIMSVGNCREGEISELQTKNESST